MSDSIDSIAELLRERHGAQGTAAAERLRHWLSGEVLHADAETLRQHLSVQRVPLLFDAFWQVLPFGTGGRRGKVGYGANRLNPATVALTVQGHCQYLLARFGGRRDPAVVVANDVRVFNDVAGSYKFLGPSHPLIGVSSRSLARLCAEIYVGNGFRVFMPSPTDAGQTLTTPELAFLIPALGAVGGLNMSASHNPPDDNGVKIYDEHGSQPVAPEDQDLLDVMAAVTNVRAVPFADAVEHGMVRDVPPEMHERYLRAYVDWYGNFFAPRQDIPIVFTPLCGCGLSTTGDVLKRLGFPMLVPPAESPDGSFAAIPFRSPNPEVPQSTGPARRFADDHGATIVLSSDPDADRVGLEGRLKDGTWYHFDGNQIAAVLAYALMLDPKGPRKSGLVIETLVTTKLLGRIVSARGESDLIDDLLVGFKYVADVLKRLQRTGSYRDIKRKPNELVLAAEESHGVIALPDILDKDAAPACALLAGLHQRLTAEGKTLLDYYIAILEELGGFDTVSRSLMMAGAVGMERKDRVMARLRSHPPRTLAGHAVTRVADYWDEKTFGPLVSESERLPRNVVQLFTARFVITVRPSGTEPKLKFYCQLLPDPGQPIPTAKGMALLDALRVEADAAARSIYNDLLATLDLSLGEVGLMLTDIIELDRKIEFEKDIVPRLAAELASGRLSRTDDVLAWLRESCVAMLPGADPLPALKTPMAWLCDQWQGKVPAPVLAELAAWAAASR